MKGFKAKARASAYFTKLGWRRGCVFVVCVCVCGGGGWVWMCVCVGVGSGCRRVCGGVCVRGGYICVYG